MWVTTWGAGWLQNRYLSAPLHPAITHFIHFMVVPRADGTLEVSGRPGFGSPGEIALTVDWVHAGPRPRKALVSVGGAGSYTAFSAAVANATTRNALIRNLAAFALANNYDGVDVDMEPVNPADVPGFQALVRGLSTALKRDNPTALLTIAGASSDACAGLQDVTDQINVMTYDMSGAFGGWVSWHNSPVTASGEHFPFPVDWRELPSCDLYLRGYIAAGIPAAKLGIGIDYYGYVWDKVNAPRQNVDHLVNNVDVHANVPYHQIVKSYDMGTTQWDTAAQAAWIGVGTAPDAAARFVSFDNEQTVKAKVQYARDSQIGGVAVWELAGGVLDDGTQPLMDALRTFSVVGRERYLTIDDGSLYVVYDPTTNAITGVHFDAGRGGSVWVRLTHRASGQVVEFTAATGETVSIGSLAGYGDVERIPDPRGGNVPELRNEKFDVEMRSPA